MNRFVSFLAAAVLAVSAVFTLDAGERGQDRRDWKDAMKAEKIAFITSELELTPQEAEKFWPVYNQAEEEHFKCMDEVMKTYMALSEAIEKKASGKQISACIDAYCKAVEAANSIDTDYVAKYKKVIPIEKVAKLYTSEEKFRRQQISRLHKGPRQDQKKK